MTYKKLQEKLQNHSLYERKRILKVFSLQLYWITERNNFGMNKVQRFFQIPTAEKTFHFYCMGKRRIDYIDSLKFKSNKNDTQ